jgi:hypothetical protein
LFTSFVKSPDETNMPDGPGLTCRGSSPPGVRLF